MFHVRRMSFFLPLFFLIPVVLTLCLGAEVFPLPPTSPEQGGLGGAFGATSYTLPSATPVTPTPKLYGGSGAGGSCLGTLGAGNDMVKMDFGWASSVLTPKWQNDPSYRLCNDRYTWQTVTTLPLNTVLQTLQWPSDLMAPPYANQVVTLQPLSTFDPVTLQAQQQTQQTGNQQTPTETNPQCLWHVNLPFVSQIDICDPIRALVNAASAAVRGIYQNTEAQISFLWQTPLQPFQDDKTSGLLTVWSTSWAIVAACIVAVVAYAALRYMLGSTVNWLAYANLAELVPRLLFGLLAAYFSKEFFIMLIQGNNALTGIFNHNSIVTIVNGKASGIVDESLQILYGLMGLCLMVEEIARMAILYLLFAFAPILFFFASLRETQRWAKTAAVGTVVVVFIQAAQTATLDVGGLVLKTVLKNTDGNLSFLNLLISLAILYLTLMLFFSLARMALGGGIEPFANRAFKLSQGTLPFAAGAVGTAAAAYRQARRNLFPLPGAHGQSPNGASGRISGGPGSSGGSGRSGNGQTVVTVGGKPFVNSGSNNNQSGGPGSGGGASAGSGNNKPGGSGSGGGVVGGSPLNKPGGSGSGGSAAVSHRSPLAPAHASGGVTSSSSSQASVSRRGRHAGASPRQQTGQWQKTPPPQMRRRTKG